MSSYPILARFLLHFHDRNPAGSDIFLVYAVFKVRFPGNILFIFPMGLSGLEPPTSRLSGVRSNQLSYKPSYCPMAVPSGDGDKEIRTLDPLLARQVLSQLSYIPIF